MNGTILLRSPRPDDKLTLPGRGLRKSLRKLQSESAVPRALRSQTAVLAVDGAPCWAQGFGHDVAFAPDARTATLLTVTFTPHI